MILNSLKTEFWIDGDENSCNPSDLMSTQSLVFQNGLVLDSSCKCNCDNDVCIRATSGASDQCGSKYWPGHSIELLQNNHVIGKFSAGFEDHSVCIFHEKVDFQNDIFELRRTGNDGVSLFFSS